MAIPTPARLLLLAAVAAAACHHRVFVSGTFTGTMAEEWGLRERAEKELRVELATHPDSVLDLSVESARIEVRTSPSEPPHVVARFEVQARTRADAETALAECRLRAEDGQVVRVDSKAIVYEDGSTTIMAHPALRLEATVRPGTRLAIRGENSSVEVTGPVRGCRVETGHGNVRVEGCQGGEIHLRSESGSLTLRDARSEAIELRTGYGSVELQGIQTTSLTAATTSGSLRLRDVSGERIELSSGYGRIEMETVTGDCSARTASGEISVDGAKGDVIRLKSGYGTIRARRSSGRVTAETESGSIDFDASGAEVTASTGYGRLQVYGDVRQAELRTTSGAIELRPSAASATGPFRCVTGYGDVRVDLPSGMAAELDAEAPSGAVSLAGVDLSGEQSRQRARGRVGAGGARFELLAKSGNVSVRQAR